MSERTVTDSVPGHMETMPKLIRLSSRRSIPSAKKASGGGPIRPTRVLPAARAKLQGAAPTIGSTQPRPQGFSLKKWEKPWGRGWDLPPLAHRRDIRDLVTFYKLKCGHDYNNCSFDSGCSILRSALIRD